MRKHLLKKADEGTPVGPAAPAAAYRAGGAHASDPALPGQTPPAAPYQPGGAYAAGSQAALRARGVPQGSVGALRGVAGAKKYAPLAMAGAGLLAGAASAGEDDSSVLRGAAGAAAGLGLGAAAMHRMSPLRGSGRQAISKMLQR